MSSPLTLESLAEPRTYELKTTAVMRMNQAAEQNTYHTVARQTLLERKPNNTYRLRLEVLSFRTENPTFFHQLAADLNQVSNDLVIQTDLYGRLERIENKGDMLRTWQRIKPDVVRKYRDYYPQPFFEAFGQNLQAEGVFEKSLRHKGLHGVLLSGLYGYGYVPEAPISGTRVLEQFINQVSLPLQTTARSTPAPATPGHLELAVEGRLHEAAFRDDDLRRLFRSMADNPLLRVDLQATCQEHYELDAAGWLVKARQQLRAEVPGIYLNEVQHELQTVN